VFTEILIGQSTIDLLQEGISERRGLASKGFMTVWKEEEAYYRRDVTAEEISQEIERLEHLTEWVRNNCSITPCTAAPKLGAERRKELENMIGKSFLEALLIAQEHACPLYCDDFANTMG